MLALQPQMELITLEQYEQLPQQKRAEVFDGEIVDMASPSRIHQELLRELLLLFGSYIKEKKGSCQIFPAPFDVLLSGSPLTIVQPDLFVVCDKNKLDDRRCNGAPDFIIEIVSPTNPSDDYVRKLYYYQTYGVREYWIIDPQRKIITVNYFEKDIVSVQYPFHSTISVNIYEDLTVDFSELGKLIGI